MSYAAKLAIYFFIGLAVFLLSAKLSIKHGQLSNVKLWGVVIISAWPVMLLILAIHYSSPYVSNAIDVLIGHNDEDK